MYDVCRFDDGNVMVRLLQLSALISSSRSMFYVKILFYSITAMRASGSSCPGLVEQANIYEPHVSSHTRQQGNSI